MNYRSQCWNPCFDLPPTPLPLAIPRPVACPVPTVTRVSVSHIAHRTARIPASSKRASDSFFVPEITYN